jgi:hypothetical protein
MHRTYVLSSAALAAFMTLALIVFCFLVDPYELYPSITASRPSGQADLFYHLRLHKPYAIESRKPQHLIVGSSRSARLPPAVMASTPEQAYNASLPGVTLREMRLMVEHAQSVRPLQSLVVGVDYYMFRSGHSDLTDHYEEDRLRKLTPSLRQRLSHRFQRFEDNWSSLLSTDALLSAWNALHSRNSSQRRYNANGTWEAATTVEKPGPRLFSMLARQKFQDFKREPQQLDATELKLLLDFCHSRDIAVTVLISPFHASIMNAVSLAGGWQSYLEWQRMVTRISATYAPQVRVLALENSPGTVLEAIGNADRFFQDGVHYTGAAGAEIMNCLAIGECAPRMRATTLEEKILPAYLQALTGLMKGYKNSNAQDYLLLQKWLKKLRSQQTEDPDGQP